MIKRILTWAWQPWLVAGSHAKSGFFPLKMISDVTIELEIALSSHICLFSSVVLHGYVELLRKIKL